ncbi:hypothetical protein SAMN05216490_3814 [Mucilaginibacter mallensis]|uniref:DUF3887 domain-containing protein n=1 Tax=Mucilaginibacter mallensis TaxID=652787 RepID=A0A1H2AZ72_MUCMA|nr:hypothetical protein [Mucilaginibacter mallensis]SDT51258.1 hypothetical protein SAMN05216490_3814 [Mucilaginibacter mallensis]
MNLNVKYFFNRTFLLAAIVCSTTLFAKAQAPATAAKPAAKPAAVAPKGAASYIETFFKKYKTSPDSAVEYLFSTNKLFTNVSQINLLKAKLDTLQLTVGKYLGRELIVQKTPTPSLVLYSYIVKHENEPVRFTFMFYKPKNDWVLYRFNYDDQIDSELIDAAKINNKK